MSPALQAVASGEYLSKSIDQVDGTGYTVACLEAALWCFTHANSFEEAILTATNLGADADTTAAVSGQLAGAHYGAAAIPRAWLDRLVMRDMIREWAERLVSAVADGGDPQS